MRGENIPTLDEVLTWGHGKTRFVIELKVAGAEEQILKLVQGHGMQSHVVIMSDLPEVLKEVKRLDPFIHTGLVTHGTPDESCVKRAIDCRANWICIENTQVSLEFARLCRTKSLRLAIGPVENEEDVKKLLKMPVAAILTNRVKSIKPIVTQHKV